MKQIKMLCRCNVLPLQTSPGADGKVDEHAKQLVFEDDDTGEVITYPMGGEFAKWLGGRLKMHNKALGDTLAKEAAAAQARTVITGAAVADGKVIGPGGAPLA